MWASFSTYILMDCVSESRLVPKPEILNVDCSVFISIYFKITTTTFVSPI